MLMIWLSLFSTCSLFQRLLNGLPLVSCTSTWRQTTFFHVPVGVSEKLYNRNSDAACLVSYTVVMTADEWLLTLLGQPNISSAFAALTTPSMILDHPWSDVLCASVFSTSLNAVISDRQNTTDCPQYSQLSAGVPRWSVLDPHLLCMLHLLCTAESDLVVSRHGPNLHHADDTQVYVNISARDAEAAIGCLTACLVDTETWLKTSRLQLNHAKTQVMWLGSNSAAAGQSRNLRSASRHVSTSQRQSSLTVSCRWCLQSGRRVSQWQLGLPTTAAPTARQVYVSQGRKSAGPLQEFISCRLEPQLTVLWHRRGFGEPAAVCPECSCASGVRCSTVRPHHASATGAALSALASGSTSGGFEDGHPSLPVTVQPIWPPTVS